MSNIRKAAEQALDALVDAVPCTAEQVIEQNNAIDALRAALAEPEQEPVTVMWRVRRHDCPDYWIPFMHYPVDAYADPEREVQELVVKCAAPPAQTPQYINQAEAENHNYLSQPVTVINKTPPPRLTDEMLRDCLRECPPDAIEPLRTRWLYAKDFARAIESAVRKQFGVNDE